MNNEQLAELKALAEAATPGPWRVGDSPWTDDFDHWDCDRVKQVWEQNEDGEDERMLECNDHALHPGELTGPFTVDVGDYYALSEANAAYIAAASSDVVLELIVEVKRLREALKWYADEENWKEQPTGSRTASGLYESAECPVWADNGENAREALTSTERTRA